MSTIDLTLQRIRLLLSYLPPYRRPTCHIAGTNGKGSVSAILSSVLLSSSPPLSVGRFNSPHLVSVLDSIVINNKPVAASTYAEARAEVEYADKQHQVGASNFELLTSTALMIFERAALDMVVMEVGMGGRLDATNAISNECVMVSALTAVDLDHQAFLGKNVSAIAKEKAGISRKGKPFVMGRQNYSEVDDVVRREIAQVGGDLVLSNDPVRRDWYGDIDSAFSSNASLSDGTFMELPFQPVTVSMPCFEKPIFARLPLFGDHQLANLGVASSIVSELITHPSCVHLGLRNKITPVTVAHGIQSTSWPGRLSFHSFTPSSGKKFQVLVDGAHNRASALALSKFISDILSRVSERADRRLRFGLTYILGLSHSPQKTPYDTLQPLFASVTTDLPNLDVSINVATVGFTIPDNMPWVEVVPPTEIRSTIGKFDAGVQSWSPEWLPSQESELHRALEWAASTFDTVDVGLIVVAGSLYVVADFYRGLVPRVLW
jgi:dihydrofolate synthase